MRLINHIPSRPTAVLLAALPFALVLVAYAIGSHLRLAENPSDKLLPSLGTIGDTAVRLFTEGDRRSGRILLWHDTRASLTRLLGGVGIAAAISLSLGMLIGLSPYARRMFSGFVAVLSTAIGLLNLFPIPVLDGGHLMFHAYEAIRGKPPSDRIMSLLTMLGLAVVIGIMAFGLTNDLFCP